MKRIGHFSLHNYELSTCTLTHKWDLMHDQHTQDAGPLPFLLHTPAPVCSHAWTCVQVGPSCSSTFAHSF